MKCTLWKRSISVLLALIFAISLAACGKTANSDTPTSAPSGNTEKATTNKKEKGTEATKAPKEEGEYKGKKEKGKTTIKEPNLTVRSIFEENYTDGAQIYNGSNRFLYWENGGYATLPVNADDAYVTADRQHIVYLTADEKSLICTDGNFQNQVEIASSDSGILLPGQSADDSFVRWEDCSDYSYYRYYYDTAQTEMDEDPYSSLHMVADTDSISSANGTAVLSRKYNKIYISREPNEEPTEIGTTIGQTELLYISDNASLAIWEHNYDENGDYYSCTLSSYSEKERAVSEIQTDYVGALCTSQFDDSFFAIDAYNDTLYIKKSGKEMIQVRVPKYEICFLCLSNGETMDVDDGGKYTTPFDYIYVATYDSVYAIDGQGNCQKLFGVNGYFWDNMQFRNGYLLYWTDDRELFTVKLNGAECGETIKIADHVESFKMSECNDTVYYLCSYDDRYKMGTLYSCELGSTTPTKITSDAYEKYIISAAGDCVYYFTDIYETSGYLSDYYKYYAPYYGNFKCWTNGKESLIDSQVLAHYDLLPDSFLVSRNMNPQSITYGKYGSIDTDNRIVCFDLYLFDGKENKLVFSNLNYK